MKFIGGGIFMIDGEADSDVVSAANRYQWRMWCVNVNVIEQGHHHDDLISHVGRLDGIRRVVSFLFFFLHEPSNRS